MLFIYWEVFYSFFNYFSSQFIFLSNIWFKTGYLTKFIRLLLLFISLLIYIFTLFQQFIDFLQITKWGFIDIRILFEKNTLILLFYLFLWILLIFIFYIQIIQITNILFHLFGCFRFIFICIVHEISESLFLFLSLYVFLICWPIFIFLFAIPFPFPYLLLFLPLFIELLLLLDCKLIKLTTSWLHKHIFSNSSYIVVDSIMIWIRFYLF